LYDRSTLVGLTSVPVSCRILAILILVLASGGCTDLEGKPGNELTDKNLKDGNLTDRNLPDQNISDNNMALALASSSISEPEIDRANLSNQILLILRNKEFNRTGSLPITLKIINPRLNETVLTVFKPDLGQEWYNQTSITYIADGNWTQNFSLMPKGNVSYVRMLVQVSENDTVVKRAVWNITFDTPVGRPN